MRTNKLFLAAAVLAAGVIGASAQSNVYSLNIVGYINVPVPAGQLKMIANQLNATPDNKLTSVLPAPPNGLKVLKWTGSGYEEYEYVDGAWSDGAELATLAPGEGVFASIGTASTVTFVGEVPKQPGTNTFGGGLQIVSSQIPMGGLAATDLKFPTTFNFSILKWNGSGYDEYPFADSAWGEAGEPTIPVGESVFVNSGSGATWVQNFSL